MRTVQAIAALTALLVAGCGDTEPDDDMQSGSRTDGGAGSNADAGGPPAGMGSLFPLATGNAWTFQVTEAGVVSMKTQTVGPLEAVGGTGPNKDVMAYRTETMKSDGSDRTVSWQLEVDDKVVRYREQSFMASTGMLDLEEHWDPYKLRVDFTEEHLMPEASWVDAYRETKLPVGMTPTTTTSTDLWRLIAASEEVEVPAGTFDAVVFEKTAPSSTKRYWFVRGIGKVKETGTQTEELVSYELVE